MYSTFEQFYWQYTQKYKSFANQYRSCMNDCIKSKILEKNFLFKQYVRNGKTSHYYQNI